MTLQELRKRRGEIASRMKELVREGITDETREEFDKLEAESKTVKDDVGRLERLEAEELELRKPAPNQPPPPALIVGDGPEDRKFESLGDNVRAILNASSPGGRVDPRLRSVDSDPGVYMLGSEKRATGMSEGTGAYGGFLLQTEHANDLLEPMFKTGVLLPRVKQYTITNPAASEVTFNVLDETDRGRGTRLGGLRLYTREEASAVTASKPKLRKWTIRPQSVMGVCYFTTEQLQDTPGVVQLVQDYFQNEAGYEIDEFILNGDGASEPLGITNHGCLIDQAIETGQEADTVVAENFINMYSRMPERNRANAIWTYPANALPQLMTLSLDLGVSSVPLWIPGNSLTNAPNNTVLGKPIVELEQSATLGDANDIMFIDPSQYLLVRKGGAQVDLSIHVEFLAGEVILRFMFRIGGGSWWNSAITPANDGDTLGPFISLAERA